MENKGNKENMNTNEKNKQSVLANCAIAEEAVKTPEKSDKNKKLSYKDKKRTLMDEINGWIATIFIVLILAALIRTYVFEPVKVQGRSMMDTLQSGEMLFVSKWRAMTGELKRGDVVICQYPNRVDWSFSIGANFRFTQHTSFVKRLIALPGDSIAILDGVVYVNDKPLDEKYITHKDVNDYPRRVLMDDEYFVMGDNRPNSNDSRSSGVGPIARNQILGHPKLVFWPLNHIRLVK